MGDWPNDHFLLQPFNVTDPLFCLQSQGSVGILDNCFFFLPSEIVHGLLTPSGPWCIIAPVAPLIFFTLLAEYECMTQRTQKTLWSCSRSHSNDQFEANQMTRLRTKTSLSTLDNLANSRAKWITENSVGHNLW